MNLKTNYFLDIFQHLKQFGMDGKFHDVESILPGLNYTEKKSILEQLQIDGFVKYKCGGISDGTILRAWYNLSRPSDPVMIPFEAMLINEHKP